MQLPSSSTAFNQFTNRRPRESRVHIYTGCHYACSLALLLAQQKPHPYNKCEVLSVCVCTLVGMCGWAGVAEGKERNSFLEAMITSHKEDNELLGSGRLVRTGRASRCNQSRSAFASP